jgi:hypothetical protein
MIFARGREKRAKINPVASAMPDMHVAVADRRERLDAEEERARKALRILIGDRGTAEFVQRREDRVQHEEQERERDEEHRPADRQRAVIEVLPDAQR